MTNTTLRGVTAALVLMAGLGTAVAQESTNVVATESAWTGSASDDERLISALRNGSNAVITGRSSRGTVTKDTFSLAGITAATNTARSRCQ